jgi:hypothetical protein
LAAALVPQLWIARHTSGISPTVRLAVTSVLRARLWSEVTGDYWENEIAAQAKLVSALPQSDRIDFFRAILFAVDLSSSGARMLTFAELVAPDASALRQDLIVRRDNAEFDGLWSVGSRREAEGWIETLKTIDDAYRSPFGCC